MSLTITLHDGSEHIAQFTTLTAILPLIKPMLKEGEDLASLSGEVAQTMLFPRLLQGLGDADFIKDLANGLLTLFPTLPSDRVWFNDTSRPTPHGVAGLEITEIFLIIAKALESANENSDLTPEKIAEYAKGLTPQAPPEISPQAALPKAFKPSKKGKR